MADSKFKLSDHPSDVSLVAFGKNKKELFENSALGMFSLIADLETIDPVETFPVKVSGDDIDSLLVNWLNELLFYEESKDIVLNGFKINKMADTWLEADVSGEIIDLDKHSIFRSIKAATYNQLQIDKNRVKIVFDV